MHRVKRTHTQPPGKRKWNFTQMRPLLYLGRQPRNEADIEGLIHKVG